jgi:voltage-dependent potassium channel beta subunit
MIYQRLGRSGLKVSLFSIGSWVTYGRQVQDDRAEKCLKTAYDAGINFFDNAEVYASGNAELVVGRFLKQLRRETFVVSSKVFWGGDSPNERGLSRKHVLEACNAALKRLHVDYLDLYYCHRPDPETPVAETCLAMDTLIRQGKVLYWGTSEWTAEQLKEAYDACAAGGLIKPTMEQPQYHMFHRERVEVELLSHYEEHGLGTTTWSPLASGLLTGKYDNGIPAGSRATLSGMEWLKDEFTPDRIEKVRQLGPVADDLGCTRAQLALAWASKCPWVSSVITGASRPEQVTENLGALQVRDQLDDGVMARIEAILDNKPGNPEAP